MNLRPTLTSIVRAALLTSWISWIAPCVLAQEGKTTPSGDAAQDTGAMPPGTDSKDEGTEEMLTTPKGPGVQKPTQTAPPEESYLHLMLRSSGPIGIVLLLMSFFTVGLTVKFVLEMRRDKVIPPWLVTEFENRIKEKRFQEAYDLAKKDPTFLGKVLSAGMSKLTTGYAQAIEAMHEVGEDESMKLEHRLSWLAILGTTGPLLGLLGTVQGIIESFRVIATSETQPKPSLLAGGISTSLFNTFEGLFVAIIATVAFMLLKNHMARLVLEVGMASGNLMSRFSSVAPGGRAAKAPGATE